MKYGFLCCGPSGVGKSSNIHKMLENANLNKDDFLLIDPDKFSIESTSSFIIRVNESIATHIFVGGSIGFIVAAMLLPIFSMSIT